MKLTQGAAPATLARLARQLAAKGRPPVLLWNPDYCGDIDMRIARDGAWYYMGTPITRQAMVNLFAGVLRRDGDQYFLVTPVEKLGIRVDDAPFVAVELEVEGAGQDQILRFRTNIGEVTTAGPEAPIRVETDRLTGEPSPYVLVRDRLEALIGRAVYYELVALGIERRDGESSQLGVWSRGCFFVLGELEGPPDPGEPE